MIASGNSVRSVWYWARTISRSITMHGVGGRAAARNSSIRVMTDYLPQVLPASTANQGTTSMETRELQVLSGTVIASRLFDVADSIDLAKAEELWRQQQRPGVTRGRLVSTPSKAVSFGVAPLDIPLEPVRVALDGVDLIAGATARLYDFGVTRLALHIPADNLSWTAFTRLVAAVHRHVGPASESPVWRTLLDRVRETFAGTLLRPTQIGR